MKKQGVYGIILFIFSKQQNRFWTKLFKTFTDSTGREVLKLRFNAIAADG
jgi:hypothetical protein